VCITCLFLCRCVSDPHFKKDSTLLNISAVPNSQKLMRFVLRTVQLQCTAYSVRTVHILPIYLSGVEYCTKLHKHIGRCAVATIKYCRFFSQTLSSIPIFTHTHIWEHIERGPEFFCAVLFVPPPFRKLRQRQLLSPSLVVFLHCV